MQNSKIAYLPPAFSFPSGLRSSATHPSSPHPSNRESWTFQIQTTHQLTRWIYEGKLTLSILTTGDDEVVVERRPGSIQYRSSVTPGQR